MSRIFVASDHHLGHEKIITFKNEYGLIRPGFTDIVHHDETIIQCHNAVVKDDDLVYFLGDLSWKTNNEALSKLNRLNGRKRICIGNHDNADWLFRTGLFERVYLWKYMPELDMILSHVPLSDADMKRVKYNVHGHTHEREWDQKRVMVTNPYNNRYNASMEMIGYTPVDIEFVHNTLGGW